MIVDAIEVRIATKELEEMIQKGLIAAVGHLELAGPYIVEEAGPADDGGAVWIRLSQKSPDEEHDAGT